MWSHPRNSCENEIIRTKRTHTSLSLLDVTFWLSRDKDEYKRILSLCCMSVEPDPYVCQNDTSTPLLIFGWQVLQHTYTYIL